MSDRDYYEALGLTPLADGAMVDQAYWHLARKYQALAVSNPGAHRMLDELNEAYGVLGNPLLRREYDAFRDDVLVASGAIRPVLSKKKRRKQASASTPSVRASAMRSSVSIPNWRWYGVSAIIAGLAFAGAWQGVNPIFVIGTLAVGLALSLTPALKRQLPSLKISMPAMPNVNLAEMKAPKLTLPRLPDGAAVAADDQFDLDELRQSTAAIIDRWRKSMGLHAAPTSGDGDQPSKTLVEIVEGERDLESESEPLTTVMEILRGSKKAPEASEQTASS